ARRRPGDAVRGNARRLRRADPRRQGARDRRLEPRRRPPRACARHERAPRSAALRVAAAALQPRRACRVRGRARAALRRAQRRRDQLLRARERLSHRQVPQQRRLRQERSRQGRRQVPERARPRRPRRARRGRGDDRRDAGAGRARVADRAAEHHRADRVGDRRAPARRARRRGAAAARRPVDRGDRSRKRRRRMSTSAKPLSLAQVLVCGAVIVTVSMGIRHGFGLWLQPITVERGWSRETFALALAVQNLAWGLAGPLAGALADRWGAFRVLTVGSILYSLGLVTMGLATTGAAFLGGTGLVLGMAQAGTTYAIVYGVIGRNVVAERRSWAMGITAAAGSFGQFL